MRHYLDGTTGNRFVSFSQAECSGYKNSSHPFERYHSLFEQSASNIPSVLQLRTQSHPSTSIMDSRQSPLRRSVTQRRSIRSAKRLARSTSGISPLAMSLLKSQHEQKKAALLRDRAYRRELFNPLTHVSYADDEQNDIDVEQPEQEQLEDLHTLDSSVLPLCSNTDDVEAEKKTTQRCKRFRAVRRRVSKVVARVFLRKSSKKAEESEAMESCAELKAFRRFPVTEL